MRWWSWLLPVLAGAAVHLPGLDGELIWDDEIVQNQQIVAFKTWRDVFWKQPANVPQWSDAYYRPIVTTSYLIDRRLFGNRDFRGHHASNVVFHCAATLFVTLLTGRALAGRRFRPWGALAGGLIFAVHPIHAEVVAHIMGRADALATAFMAAALLAALACRDATTTRGALLALLLAGGCCLAGLLSKEVGIAALALLVIVLPLVPAPAAPAAPVPPRGPSRTPRRDAASAGAPLHPGVADGARSARRAIVPRRWRIALLIGVFLAASAVYFVLRQHNAPRMGRALSLDAPALALRAARALAYYARMTLVPWPQSAFVTEDQLPPAWAGTAVVLGFCALLAAGAWRARAGRPVLLLALAWFGATLAPSMLIALRRISEQPVAERYLYAPSAALAFLTGAAVSAVAGARRLRGAALSAAAVVVVAFAWLTLVRVNVYQTEIAFWQDARRRSPQAGLPTYQLGLAYSREATRATDPKERDRLTAEALVHLHASLKLYDDAEGRGLANNTIGSIELARGDVAAAERHFQAAVAENPGYATPHFNLGLLYGNRAEEHFRATGKADMESLMQSYNCLATAVRLNPWYVRAHYFLARRSWQLGLAFSQNGDVERARQAFQFARDTAEWLGRFDRAGDFGRRAVEMIPSIDRALRELPPG